jgi:hypothetical protein
MERAPPYVVPSYSLFPWCDTRRCTAPEADVVSFGEEWFRDCNSETNLSYDGAVPIAPVGPRQAIKAVASIFAGHHRRAGV